MNQGWDKLFDEKFTRKNHQTHQFEEKWFVLEAIRAVDIKNFIRCLLAHQRYQVLEDLNKCNKCEVCDEHKKVLEM